VIEDRAAQIRAAGVGAGERSPGEIGASEIGVLQIVAAEIGAKRLSPEKNSILLRDGTTLNYDYLVIATGPKLASSKSAPAASADFRMARISPIDWFFISASETVLALTARRTAPSTGSCPPSELQRSQRQNVRLVKTGHRTDGRDSQRVLGQRARLVGAQDIHRRRFIHRGKAGGKDAPLCQGSRPERRRKGEGSRQRDRYRCEHRRQDKRNDLGEGHFEKIGIGHQHRDDDAVECGKIAHHAENRLLLSTYDMGDAHELRRAAELGARAGRRDLRDRFTAPDQRPCIGLHACAGFDGRRFPGEHGLIEQDFSSSEAHIGGDHGAE
jgi:hypothetical protein